MDFVLDKLLAELLGSEAWLSLGTSCRREEAGAWLNVQNTAACQWVFYDWCRVDAGKVELDATRYLNFRLPFTITQLVWIEAILVGGAEIYRNAELDPTKRVYPGRFSRSFHTP